MKKESPVFLFLSALLSNFIDQVFSILPSKTRIGDRASRGHVVADVLASFEQVALDHDTFDKFVKFRIAVAAVENFVYDTDLLLVFLVGVRMVGKFYRSQAGTARLEPRDGSADRLRGGAERLRAALPAGRAGI